ncbi:MAG: class I SAM-dependent methyltransferase, partial [Acidimicrobiia bacterium]|nr:class I SAM-dependent methyltransferase [Acidimicrobiia bacterium]
FAALGDARTVLDVGSGTGSYQPAGRTVVAVEPSSVMIAQRSARAAPVARARAEALPVRTSSFDAVMAVLTVHHWLDRQAGFAELRRVAPRRVVLTFDAEVHARMWLFDYVPEIAELDSRRAPSVQEVVDAVEGHSVVTVPVPHDCVDEMTVALWRRPEAYLDPGRRAAGSGPQQVDTAAFQRGLGQLARDLESGEWHRRYGDLLALDELDCGLRLVVGGG